MKPVSNRVRQIEPFHVMALLARARELEVAGRDIVHMEVGEPDFATPTAIQQAGIQALQEQKTHYTPATGLPALRQAISHYYQSRYGVAVAAERILITPGASGALQLVIALLADAGETVVLTDPGYPCNRNVVQCLAAKPVTVACGIGEQAALDAQLFEQSVAGPVAALLLASPSNPTGDILDLETLAELERWVSGRGGALVVDEIYQGLEYGQASRTVCSLNNPDIYVINSFSKFFGMTGWRVGWLVAPEQTVADLDKLAQNLFLAASTPAQHAALAAFLPDTLDELERRRRIFQQRRDYLRPALEQLGFKMLSVPRGAFYLYADCSAFSDDSMRFCDEMLEQIGVAVTPGVDFGQQQASRRVRFAYTTSLERLQEGIKRLSGYLSGSQ
ncbi:MAG TPA: pyridoxal phosphate-dependent aminotransferase [Gammaproteobacteria bacterium]|nr:pyridoxal phosphate-dependent aminotransferase [Gammaproteobacteria bacterium]